MTSTQFGGTTTLKASRRFGGGGMGIPLTETITISNGVGGDVGFWVDEDGNKVDFIELDICVNNVEKKLRLLGMIIEP